MMKRRSGKVGNLSRCSGEPHSDPYIYIYIYIYYRWYRALAADNMCTHIHKTHKHKHTYDANGENEREIGRPYYMYGAATFCFGVIIISCNTNKNYCSVSSYEELILVAWQMSTMYYFYCYRCVLFQSMFLHIYYSLHYLLTLVCIFLPISTEEKVVFSRPLQNTYRNSSAQTFFFLDFSCATTVSRTTKKKSKNAISVLCVLQASGWAVIDVRPDPRRRKP